MTTLLNMIRRGNWVMELAAQGRVFNSGDADQNDTVTAQTSFATTTPTFMIDVPLGTTCIPLKFQLTQSGTLAAAVIPVLFEYDKIDRYASGGTAEKVMNHRPDFVNADGSQKNLCTFYSGATANAGYGMMLDRFQVGQDISTAEGAVNEILWTPEMGAPPILVGPAAFLVYSYVGTTAPTWLWACRWAELPTSEVV